MQRRLIYLSIFLVLITTFSKSAIRVNQVGYDLEGPKYAVLDLSDETVSSDSFFILNENNVVFAGKLSGPLDISGWGGPFMVCDFSSFRAPGIYSLQYGDSQSVSFEIDTNILVTRTYEDAVTFFTGMRNTNDDSQVPVFGSADVYRNVNGGWNDATGDRGKYLSHLAYSNFFPPQQIPFVVWSLLKSLDLNPEISSEMRLKIISEAAWGADYLCRVLDPEGFFYINVFDRWGWDTREICTWYYNPDEPDVNLRTGVKSTDYQAAFREGGGVAIAALARCARLNVSGELSAEYLNSAQKAYTHLLEKNISYCDDGVENIIDDYCALLAATELYRATSETSYLNDASDRAQELLQMVSSQGFFWSDKDFKRPFYHAADEGLPVIALLEYMDLVPADEKNVKEAIKTVLNGYIERALEVPNPFYYPRLSHVPPFSFSGGENNIAKEKPVSVSQIQNDFPAENMCDGSATTRWASGEPYSDTEWVVIDLEEQYEISSVVLNWEAAYGKKYDIQISDDNITWTTVVSIENEGPGRKVHTFEPVCCQFVKMQGRERGIEYGFSIYEFEVYGGRRNTDNQQVDVSFFIPHQNETGYWWQGENARLSSITAAAYLSWNAGVNLSDTILTLASANLDWILGKNPFGVCMMYGKGVLNYPDYPGIDAFPNVPGGICNGITGDTLDTNFPLWKPYDDGNTENWRWIEQWLPHNSWYVLAVSAQGIVDWDKEQGNKVRLARPNKNESKVKHRITRNSLEITLLQKEQGICTISTLSGKVVLKRNYEKKSKNISIPLNSVSNGLYVLRISGDKTVQSIPIFLHK